MKRTGLLILLAMLMMSLSGCQPPEAAFKPERQPNTTWVCKEYNITIHIDTNYEGTGTLMVGDKQIDFAFVGGFGLGVELYEPDYTYLDDEYTDCYIIDEEKCYERWIGDYSPFGYFTVTVEETTFFTVGETLTFFRANQYSGPT